MLCGGFFAAHGIDGSSSIGIITGLLMLGIATAWSLAEKWLQLKPGQLTDSAILRTIAGALASQIVTGLSAYFAMDANQPELLGVAVLNAGLSKAGVHQRLAGAPVVKVLVACLALLCLPSCSSFTRDDARAAGAEIGLAAADAAIFRPAMLADILIGYGAVDRSTQADRVAQHARIGTLHRITLAPDVRWRVTFWQRFAGLGDHDAYSALLHEFGHCLGLPHSRNFTHVMHAELGSTVISSEEAAGYRKFLHLV